MASRCSTRRSACTGACSRTGGSRSSTSCLLSPHGGGLRGFILLHGSAEQLAAVENDPEYRRNLVDANMVVRELGAVRGWVNEGIADQMALFQEAIRRVPQAS